MSKAKKKGGNKANSSAKGAAANNSRANARTAETAAIPRGWGEFLGVSLLAIGALMFGGLFSFQFGDGTFMGPVGQIVAGALYAGFGMAGYLVALGVVGIGFKALSGHRMEIRLGEGVGFSFATIAGCILLHVSFPEYRVHRYTAGGLTGELLGEVSLGLFDYAGTYLICLTVLCLGLIASTPLEAQHLTGAGRYGAGWVRNAGVYLWEGVMSVVDSGREALVEGEEWTEDEEYEDYDEEGEYEDDWEDEEETEESEEAPPKLTRKAKAKAAKAKKAQANQKKANTKKANTKRSDADSEEPDFGVSEDSESNIESAGKTIVLDEPEVVDNRKAKKAAPKKIAAKAKPAPEVEAEAEPELEAELDAEEAEDAADDDGPEIILPVIEEVDPKRKKAPPRAAELQARKVDMPKPEPKEKKPPGAGRVEYLKGTYELPPLELFAPPKHQKVEVDKDFVKQQADAIVDTLAQFRIKGKVTKIHPGPVITRYEFKPEAGIKVSKIQSLENDLAMALEAIRIRILAPIPGKSTVGLEVPNKSRENVYLQENLADESFGENGKMALPMVLGNDIVGRAVSIDLAKAPHLLVAGATGSGKSVGVNAMISSLMYSKTPEELRMILIDPKMLEFSVYQDIPHLLLPVITDAEKANLALRWTVNEMERRYEVLSKVKVRNVAGYNDKLPQLQAEWEAELKMREAEAAMAAAAVAAEGEDAVGGKELSGLVIGPDGQTSMAFGGEELEPRPEKMPMIVVIIDEFADLMMVASKEVEANVARIAAKARAAGIHLIVATQRPSVDVITGTIKNNFPSRIAFQVTSDMDSRTILDKKGAKQLLGMGDMLYMDRGKEPRRVHGAFVSEAEIEKVVDFVKKQAKPSYDLSITARQDSSEEEEEDREIDPLYDKAVAIVAEKGKVSTSMIQRHLSVGYNRAAKLVDAMEVEGVIGPPNGSKPRDVYISAA